MIARTYRIVQGLVWFAAVAVAWLALALAGPAHAQQPLQWNYSFDAQGNALATYPGSIAITGNCTGCSGTNLLTTPNTWSATQTFQGGTSSLAAIFNNIGEPATIVAGAPPATTNFDVLTSSVRYATVAAANNWTLNLRGNGSTTLGSLMSVGQAVTVAHVTTQGATAFFASAVQVDGSAAGVTVKWQSGVPVQGNANGLDVYTFTVIKVDATPTYLVLASQVPFK